MADSDAGGAAKGSPGVLSGNNVQVPVDAPVNACGNTVDAVALLNPAFGNSCDSGSGPGRHRHHGDAYGGDDSGSGYGGSGYGGSEYGGSGPDWGGPSGSSSHGGSGDSPGVGSGNHVDTPVDVPVTVCGDSADVISGGNPAYGDDCGSTPPPTGGDETPTPTPTPTPPTGGDETPTPTPTPPTGGDETPTPTPPTGGDETPTPSPTPPVQPDQSPPPGPHGPPPSLPDTGSNSRALLGLSGASALLIAGGAVLYRRGRAASHR
ncbi:chaplin [Streptomyces sp. NPDC090106]|uniref:chaplin n=1 Tax=Streptomyces sp. NPDC090106 TaxID=3365946 RepID=UPI003826F110